MAKFELNTSFQFPFFRVTELVSYTEVKKPSGVAYMLLVLINKSKDKKANLSITLENFGIPKSLHFIYENALRDLENKNIIEVDRERDAFDEYLISDFSFTAEGKKVFREESIPTGVIKETRIPIWYDIALNNFSIGLLNSDMEPKPLMDSAITPEFMEQFRINKDVEDFLKSNQGKRIPIYDDNSKRQGDVTIKKEEVITKVETLDQKNWVAKYDCSIEINDDNLDFEFDNEQLKKFFDKYYSAEIINKFLTLKTKFNFESSYTDGLKLSSFNNFDIAQVLIPKEIRDELKKKNKLLVTRGNYTNSGIFSIDGTKGLDIISNSCEFMVVGQDNSIYAYVPGVFVFSNKIFGDIRIPLVLKLRISTEELQKIALPYLEARHAYSEESFKDIVRLTNITKDTKTACDILDGYMTHNFENNIVLLKEIKDSAITNETISQRYKALLADNYHNYAKTIDEDKLESFLKITHSIPKFIGLNENDVLTEIFTNIGDIQSNLNAYETLVESGFDRKVAAFYANPIPEVLNGKTSTDKFVLDFINYRTCVKHMKSLTGINDPFNYVIDLEKIEKIEFKERYSTASSLTNQISFFKEKNTDAFNSMESFMNIFKKINDDFNMLDVALKNPNNITPELIDKKIVNGDYQFVFVNLAAKLESILKTKFKLDGTLWERLTVAKKEKLIDRNIVYDLLTFKENRNAYIHPEERDDNFQPDDIRRWSKEIFELGKEEDKK